MKYIKLCFLGVLFSFFLVSCEDEITVEDDVPTITPIHVGGGENRLLISNTSYSADTASVNAPITLSSGHIANYHLQLNSFFTSAGQFFTLLWYPAGNEFTLQEGKVYAGYTGYTSVPVDTQEMIDWFNAGSDPDTKPYLEEENYDASGVTIKVTDLEEEVSIIEVNVNDIENPGQTIVMDYITDHATLEISGNMIAVSDGSSIPVSGTLFVKVEHLRKK